MIFAVDSPALDRFVASATSALSQKTTQVMLTPGIHAAFQRGVEDLTGNAAVQVVGRGAQADGPNRSPAAFFETDANHFLADGHLASEVFGASSVLVRCASFAQILEVTEKLKGQLTATLQLDVSDYARL